MKLAWLAAVLPAALLAETLSVKSPDGKNEIRLDTQPVLSYSVLREGIVRVAPTPLALDIEGFGALGGAGLSFDSISANDRRGSYAPPAGVYKKALVSNEARGMDVTLKGGKADGLWKVALIARDDGVAYRFETSLPGTVKVVKEDAGVFFADTNVTLWAGINWGKHPWASSWESVYAKCPPSVLPQMGQLVYLPLLAQYPDGVTMCVTESDLLDYPGWNLTRADETSKGFVSFSAPFPLKSVNTDWGNPDLGDKPGRARNVVERAPYLAATRGTRTFPWRTFILAPTPVKLCEADIVHALASDCRLTGDLTWIKPGKVAWDWWNDWNVSGVPFRAGCNTKTYEYYIDFAAKTGVEYVIFDEGWSEKLDIRTYHPDVDVPHLVKYAEKRGVGIILWCAWAQLVGCQEEMFAKFAKMGVKGFKIDFMDRDDQELVNFIEDTARIAAKYKLIVDYHGMYKPTGLTRTYPNVINYEGVHGLENAKWEPGTVDFPKNDVVTFFGRMTAGPMDYTPGAMRNMTKDAYRPNNREPGSQGTRVHQMALMSLYEAPLQMLCDSPTQYMRNEECFTFMAAVPTVWDEVMGLSGAIEKYVCAARRKGDVWYVSAINDFEARKILVDFSFLGEGSWKAEIFRDGVNADRDATDYVHETVKLDTSKPLVIELAPGGGWTAKITKKTGLFW